MQNKFDILKVSSIVVSTFLCPSNSCISRILVDDDGINRLAYLPVRDPRILFQVLPEHLDNRLEFVGGFVLGEPEELLNPPNQVWYMLGFGNW